MTRILVLEDSPTQSEKLRLILEGEGFEVVTGVNGRKGLELLTDSHFDLVISDIVMPDVSGYDFCKAVKADPLKKDIPVILLTSLSDPMDIIQGLACGADNFITKPYEPTSLIGRVRGILDNKRMRASGHLKVGVEIFFLGKKFSVTSDKEQILDLLISTFEDIVRKNRELQIRESELAAAQIKIGDYARKMELQVRASEEKYRSLMEHANDMIFVIDEKGVILEANYQAERLLKRKSSALEGMPFVNLVVPGERDYAGTHFSKLLSDGNTSITDLHIEKEGDVPVCVDLSASMVNTDGKRFVLAIVRDVTERKLLQIQALQNEKLAAIGMLAAGIAHEINNPTAVILSNMNVLRSHADSLRGFLDAARLIPANSDEGARKTLDGLLEDPKLNRASLETDEIIQDCTQAGERIRDIVMDLKGFSRIDGGDIRIVNINEIIHTTLRMSYSETKYRARIEKNLSHDLPPVVASPGRMSQVFLNLIINAAQAIEEGDVEHNKITVNSRLEGGRIRVDISDSGRGISKELQRKIFDPFFTTKPIGMGTGLGLSICQDIVKKHNGEILVASELEQGTTFSIYLPVEMGLVLEPAPAPSQTLTVDRLKLLLVDDEISMLRSLQRVLNIHHDVAIALGGRAALENLRDSTVRYDFIICDLLMPDIDGVDLYRYIVERFQGLERRMIFVTGGAYTPRSQEFLARIPNLRLDKPFSADDLLRALAAQHSRVQAGKI